MHVGIATLIINLLIKPSLTVSYFMNHFCFYYDGHMDILNYFIQVFYCRNCSIFKPESIIYLKIIKIIKYVVKI